MVKSNKKQNLFLYIFKNILTCCLILVSFIYLLFCNVETYASSNNLNIKIEKSNIYNLIYDVCDKNGNKVPNVDFIIKDKNTGEIISTSKTDKDSILIFENIPFGDYIIYPKKDSGWFGEKEVILNDKYLDENHDYEKYIVYRNRDSVSSNKPAKTSDSSNLNIYILSIISSLLAITLIIIFNYNSKHNKK